MIYTADHIVTQDPARTIIKDGALAIEGDRIAAIGSRAEILAARPDDQIDALGSAVIMPGLIDAHTHIPMSFQRGYADDKALMDWLTQDIFPVETRLNHDILRDASLFACAELIRLGCTAFYDMYMLQSAAYEAVAQTGLRAVLGECVTKNYPSFAAKNQAEIFASIRRQAADWRGHPRIRGAVTPHAIYTTTPALLRDCRALADETGFLYGMHLSETQGETRDCLSERHLRPIEYLDSLGVITPDTTFFHCVDLTPADIDILATRGAAAVHNPASNMKLASGVAPISEMHSRGLPVALGTDGPASNNAQNMLREMYLAALLHKVANLDPLQAPAQTVLDMATLGGAAALKNPEIGSLEPGKKADFIALSLDTPNMRPIHNIVSNIVYAASGLENRLTVVDGIVLYKDGDYKTLDIARVLRQADRLGDWLRS